MNWKLGKMKENSIKNENLYLDIEKDMSGKKRSKQSEETMEMVSCAKGYQIKQHTFSTYNSSSIHKHSAFKLSW